ncbi:NUDIX domain-containing protein [Candidatus Acetothermia bacterium]|nr:NUDIX domain-containing protein [Candidatus Acetothermia bacterium]MBI3644221.1 NUDIX domain-containing protein [Candidatus Acetothermia bacterium]
MPNIKTHVVNVYVFRLSPQGPQYLALQRRKEIDRLGGTWQAVHGGIEAGETAAQAAARELWEESGLQLESLWALDIVETFYVYQEDAIVLAPSFGAQARGEVRLSSEHDSYKWLTLDEITDILVWPGQKEAILTLHNEIAIRLFEKRAVSPLMKITPEFYQKTT